MFNVLKKIHRAVLKFFAKNAQIQKLPQNYDANDLRKTIHSRDREHQFQQNFLGVK